MNKKHKLLLGGLLVVVVFFVTTFSKNWGTAVSGNQLEKYRPVVRELKEHRVQARKLCPDIIAHLEVSLTELGKSQDRTQLPIAQKLIAQCAQYSGAHAKALQYYQALTQFEPNNARWYANVAETYMALGRPGEALQPSVLATQLAPADFKTRLLNAQILAQLHLRNRAIEAYREAIKIAPYDELPGTRKALEAYMQQPDGMDTVR